MRRTRIGVAAMILSATVLSACSNGSNSTPSETSTPGPTKVGGMTECTVKAVQPFLTNYVEYVDKANQMPIRELLCANGWAVATGILGPKNAPANGPQGAPTSVILEAEGQFWIVKDKAKVCGTYDSNAPDALPADALVPAALYKSGCLAG